MNSNHTHRPRLQTYKVVLRDQPDWHLLARDKEAAAFAALELAQAKDTDLLDVKYYEEW